MKHTIVALVQDRPGVLNRIASVFRRRDINIETLHAERTAEPGVSKVLLTVEVEKVQAIVAQLEKLIDVFEIRIDDSATTTNPNYVTNTFTPSKWHQADGAA